MHTKVSGCQHRASEIQTGAPRSHTSASVRMRYSYVCESNRVLAMRIRNSSRGRYLFFICIKNRKIVMVCMVMVASEGGSECACVRMVV